MTYPLCILSTGPLWSIRAPATLDKINPTVDKSSVPYGGVTHTGQVVSRIRARGKPSRHLGFSLSAARRIVPTIAEIEAEQHGSSADAAAADGRQGCLWDAELCENIAPRLADPCHTFQPHFLTQGLGLLGGTGPRSTSRNIAVGMRALAVGVSVIYARTAPVESGISP